MKYGPKSCCFSQSFSHFNYKFSCFSKLPFFCHFQFWEVVKIILYSQLITVGHIFPTLSKSIKLYTTPRATYTGWWVCSPFQENIKDHQTSLELFLYFIVEFWVAVTGTGILYSNKRGQYLDESINVNNLEYKPLFWEKFILIKFPTPINCQ